MTEEQADIEFLLLRAGCAGSCPFTSERWTGQSSNSIVSVAYGGKQVDLPWDRSDYAACVRTVRRLPKHRKTPEVMAALKLAREHYLSRYPNHASSLQRRAEREEWERQKQRRGRRKRA
jgi:hypothetical protein